MDYQNTLAIYRAGGDVRPASEIIAEIQTDALAFAQPAPLPDAVVGSKRLVMPNGEIQEIEFMGDGSERAKL